MPHADVHAISARQNKMNVRCVVVLACLVCGFCCRYLRHLPRSRHSVSSHCQPLQSTPLTLISHFITSHLNSRRWQARRCSAFLGVADTHKFHCCSQVLLAGFAALAALAGVGSHNVQQQLAQVAEPWSGPHHPTTISLSACD